MKFALNDALCWSARSFDRAILSISAWLSSAGTSCSTGSATWAKCDRARWARAEASVTRVSLSK